MTTSDYLEQLQQDKSDLVDNLTTKGITGLTGDETFTELVPEVLNIAGTTEIVDYVVADYSAFTLDANNWGGNIYVLSISTASYTVGANLQIGIPLDSSTANTANLIDAGLSITASGANSITFSAVNTPSSNLNIIIFGVSAVS